MTEEAMLAWVAGLIRQAQSSGTYGTVTIHLEAGKILRAQVAANYKPPAAGVNARETGS
ncbi:hypothetical protein ACFOGJ_08880 [Marinibaculum pumilum]|uniref:DUF2292 domain-containing protein n=1 Tax=Marinibaculum pumilum TaxID=1766165 RepID=A0ABV7KY63_9PROT